MQETTHKNEGGVIENNKTTPKKQCVSCTNKRKIANESFLSRSANLLKRLISQAK